jgi:hypothetical protein
MRIALGVAVAVAFTGCNCGGNGQPGSGTLCGDFSPVLASMCGFLDRCPNGSPYPIAYRSQNECTDILCYSLTCRLDVQESGGTPTFTLQQSIPKVDATKQKACTDFIDHAPCDLFTDGGMLMSGNPCDGMLAFNDSSSNNSDLKTLGQDCSSGSCATDLYCSQSVFNPDSGYKTCEVCKPKAGLGEVCGSIDCKSGLHCEYPSDGGMNRCVTDLLPGAACTYGGQCASTFCDRRTNQCDTGGQTGAACTTMDDCRQGFCNAMGRCNDLLNNGAPCTDSPQCNNHYCDTGGMICGRVLDAGCGFGSDCASGNCSSNFCVPALPDGSHCMNASECQSGYCNFSSQTCAPHCNNDSDCTAGQYCDFQSEQCRSQGMDGAGCEEDNQCVSGHCNQESQKCGTPKGPGGMCGNNLDCTLDCYCSSGTCTKRLQPGAMCPGGDVCAAPFLCVNMVCTLINLECMPAKAGEMCAYLRVCDDSAYCDFSSNFTCKARVAAGSMCSSDEMCLDGSCVNSMCVTHKADGASCMSSSECKTGRVCLMGTCQVSAVGQRCNGSSACPSPLYCSENDTCQAPGGVGAQCFSFESGACQSGLYCTESDKCAQTLAPDAGCTGFTDGECGTGAFCNRNGGSPYHCSASPGLDAGCDTTTGCQAGLYCYEDDRCVEQLGVGQSCNGNDQCSSGVCDFSYGCLAGTMCMP